MNCRSSSIPGQGRLWGHRVGNSLDTREKQPGQFPRGFFSFSLRKGQSCLWGDGQGSGNSTSVLGTPRELNQIHSVQHALWALLAFGHFMGLECFGNTYGGGVGWREVGEPGKAEHPPATPMTLLPAAMTGSAFRTLILRVWGSCWSSSVSSFLELPYSASLPYIEPCSFNE